MRHVSLHGCVSKLYGWCGENDYKEAKVMMVHGFAKVCIFQALRYQMEIRLTIQPVMVAFMGLKPFIDT